MKKLAYIFTVIVCINGKAFNQSCIPTAIVFTSQSQIDSFSINYSGCTVIEGSIGVLGDNITNLNGLFQLAEIGGSVQILDAPNLIDLQGLNNLSKIGGQLRIKGGQFSNLNGLNKLKIIGSHFMVSEIDSLEIFFGIDSLKRIGGDFDFHSGSNFNNFIGFNSLDSVNGSLSLHGNIPNCIGFDSLQFVGGNLNLEGNTFSLSGFNNLKEISGSLILVQTYLGDFIGLDSLKHIGGSLFAYGNTNLVNFSGLNSLKSVNSLFITYNNNLISLTGLDSLVTLEEGVLIDISNSGNSIDLHPFNSLSNFNGYIDLRGNFFGLGVFSEFDTLGGISITNNNIITDISNFDSLVHLGGLYINNNPILVAISGFESLQSLGSLQLLDNQFLVSIEGLNHSVTFAGLSLQIQNNALLDNCNIELICNLLWQSNIQNNVLIFGNSVNCSSISSVVQSCGNAPDADGDGINDLIDNCLNVPNTNQLDCNDNGIGDACEQLDTDCDGIFDVNDNCPNYANPFQTDLNNNGIGDACEDFPKIGINRTNPKAEFHISNGSIFIDNPEKGIILKNHQGQCYTFKAIGNTMQIIYIPCPQ